jgi:hypothetical protein
MELTTAAIRGIGIFKDNILTAIVVENGKPVHYSVEEMGNQAMEQLYEVNIAKLSN